VDREEEVRGLMARLMQAVEASLSTSPAVREALAELTRQGYQARFFFVANSDADDPEEEVARDPVLEDDGSPGAGRFVRELGVGPDEAEFRFQLTRLDRDFLRSLHIRPESE
jgi:hypothetical protein